MAKILLVDTGFTAAMLLAELERAGHEVWVMGQNPQDCLAKAAPHYIQANYADLSAVQRVIDEYQIERVIPGCNDVSYEVCAALKRANPTRIVGVDDAETLAILTQKKRFREFAHQNHLSSPRFFAPETLSAADLPVIIKPVDAFSGRGVSVVEDLAALPAALAAARAASRCGEVIIESFIDGDLYSHSAFLSAGKITQDFFVAEFCTENPFAVDTSFVVWDFPADKKLKIRAEIEKIAQLLALEDGLIHTQFILNASGFVMIEITRRCPGDLYAHLIQQSSGFAYVAHYLASFLGQTLPPPSEVEPRFVLRKTLTQTSGGQFFAFAWDIEARLLDFVPLLLTGEDRAPAPLGRVGVAFFEFSSWASLHSFAKKTIEQSAFLLKDYAQFYASSLQDF